MSVNVGQRNVPDTVGNAYLEAGVQARNLAVHTLRICKNEKIFLPEYRNAITDDLVRTSKDIFITAIDANSVRVQTVDDWTYRRSQQRRAIQMCTEMLSMISIAKQLFHLRGRKVKHWVGLVVDTKRMLRAWSEKDQERYGKIRV